MSIVVTVTTEILVPQGFRPEITPKSREKLFIAPEVLFMKESPLVCVLSLIKNHVSKKTLKGRLSL